MGSALERRPLGGTGLQVSALGVGCAKLGAFWQGRRPSEGTRAIEEAHASGVNYFDTADCYARGLSERIVGRAVRPCRDEVVISTKVGLLKTPLALASSVRHGGERVGTRHLRGLAPDGDAAQCFAPRYIEVAVDRSLRRLATDRVDILLLHVPPLDVLRAQEFLPTLERLRASGRILHFGVSCRTAEEGRAALQVPGVACVQVPHNAAGADVIPDLLPEARRRNVGLIAMAPFGDGTLLAAAPRLGMTPAALAAACLAFALATPGVASVLAGMSTSGHVVANVRAATGPPPSDAELASLRTALAETSPPSC